MSIYAVLVMVLLSAAPVTELRGGIPFGMEAGFSPLVVFIVCIAVNCLVMIPIYVFMDYFFRYIEHWGSVKRTLDRVHKKSHKLVEKYGYIGLFLFVAVPLPGSGAYSGVLAAHVLGMDRRKAIPAIIGGVVVAGIVVAVTWAGVFARFLHLFI